MLDGVQTLAFFRQDRVGGLPWQTSAGAVFVVHLMPLVQPTRILPLLPIVVDDRLRGHDETGGSGRAAAHRLDPIPID